MLILLYRKIFSAFYPILHESFSNNYGFALLQEFNLFYPDLLLYDRKHFCSILTNLSNLFLFLFHQRFPLLSQVFFSIWVFFNEHSPFTGQQGKGEGIYLTLYYRLHRHISQAIAAENSPLHIPSSRTRTGNHWNSKMGNRDPKNAEATVRKCSSEAVAQRSSVKKMFLKISQRHLCQSLFRRRSTTLFKKRPWHRCFL